MADGALLKEQYENGRCFTYADYKDWELAEGERYELIYGEAYAMSTPNANHQSILVGLAVQIANYLSGKPCKVYPAPYDVRLFFEEDESDDTVVQPDISVVCGADKRGKENCHGAPDFVAEILSPSNTAIEMQRKFELYREAGVKEYWVLDPGQKTIYAYGLNKGATFYRVYRNSGEAPVAIFPGFAIDIEPVFAE